LSPKPAKTFCPTNIPSVKKKHCSNWMERGRVAKEQSNSVGKLRRIEDSGFELCKKYCSRWMERG
jgi:hypothetical protein